MKVHDIFEEKVLIDFCLTFLLCLLVHWTKVASALEGLRIQLKASLRWRHLDVVVRINLCSDVLKIVHTYLTFLWAIPMKERKRTRHSATSFSVYNKKQNIPMFLTL